MKIKNMVNIFVLLLVLISCTASMAFAADDDNKEAKADKVINKGDIDTDKIYSDNYVLGQEKGNGKLSDLTDVDEYIATLSAFDVIWALIMLAFTLIGSAIIVGYLLVILWNALKKIIASKGENSDLAVAEIKKINNKDTSVSIGVGFSFVLIAVAMFILTLL
jgi:hypothetical protein